MTSEAFPRPQTRAGRPKCEGGFPPSHEGRRGTARNAVRFRESGERGNSDGDVEFSFCPPREGGRQAIEPMIGEFRTVKSAGNAEDIYAKADTSNHAVCAGCIGGKREKIRAAGAVQANNKEHLWNCTKDF